MKKILIVAAVIVVLIAAGIFLLLANLDSLIAKAIEKHGSEVTRTGVSVSGVEISLKEGRGTIRGLSIESPAGYDAREAFSLSDITLDIDVQSLRDDPIVIDEIRIIAPVVYAEATETGSTNIDELRKNVQASVGESSNSGDGGSGGQAKKIRIKRFVFEQGSIEVDATALGMEKRTLVLPEIRIDDIGGPGGATPGDITRIVLGAVAKRAASEVAESGIKESLKEKAGDEAKKLLDKIGG
jgi:uncharacterized protein involved in outer membrane biogenesis